jgi:hypothetical protein
VSFGKRTSNAGRMGAAAGIGFGTAQAGVSAAAVSVGVRAAAAAAASDQFDKSPVDVAWLVLEAANDLGDDMAVEACRRVIDASLNGKPAPQADLTLVTDYFR